MIGKAISHYRVTAKLGAGGMGVVYRATDTKLGRDVALKVLPPVFANDSQRMARFKREAHVLASLNHPNIASIYGLEESDGIHCLVLELLGGLDAGKPVFTCNRRRAKKLIPAWAAMTGKSKVPTHSCCLPKAAGQGTFVLSTKLSMEQTLGRKRRKTLIRSSSYWS